MLSIFMRPKPCRIMILLRDNESSWHLSKLARGSGSTHVYVSGFITGLAEKGLVTVEVKGKKKFVKLTEKGMKIANAIEELDKSIKENVSG